MACFMCRLMSDLVTYKLMASVLSETVIKQLKLGKKAFAHQIFCKHD